MKIFGYPHTEFPFVYHGVTIPEFFRAGFALALKDVVEKPYLEIQVFVEQCMQFIK
jgi:hypothetical protein